MSKPEDAPAEYIQVIVRRGHAEEEGHHGGVWKIAYADFMTAMMAFFLVMWLVNASNTEMKSSVASYFNPIKLSDNVIRKKGLLDVDGKANADESAKTWSNTPPGRADLKSDKGEQALAEYGGSPDAAPEQGPGAARTSSDTATGREGRANEAGRAFRDPFNPFAPGQLMSKEGADKGTNKGTGASSTSTREQASGQSPSTPALGNGRDAAQSPTQQLTAESGKAGTAARSSGPAGEARESGPAQARGEGSKPEMAKGEGAKPDPAAGSGPSSQQQLAVSAANILREIQTVAKPVVGDGGPGIEVTIEGNGLVLSLTDTSTFGMFPIGSSDPSKQLTELINRIAPVVAANGKRIVIRGHTDSRVYRTEKSNNWRLSVSRAEAAYSMLVRAGIDEARFGRIEGYADRKLKVANDPEAAANRRIEILLQQVAE